MFPTRNVPEEARVRRILPIALTLVAIALLFHAAPAGAVSLPGLQLNIGGAEGAEAHGLGPALQIMLGLTVLSLAPAILILMTSFTRIVVVLGFLRQAMGTQQMPPNQLIIGLSLFLTAAVMSPVIEQIRAEAIAPYLAAEIDDGQALQRGVAPLKTFMLAQTGDRELALFLEIGDKPQPESRLETPLTVVIPAFVLSELKRAFQIGFVLFVPFLVIDMVVASILMSMGMMMLPPVMISLPFKVLLFVLVDGWNLLVQSLIRSFGA
ncbi:MAG: flagellar type III secretion system pore protein FliP [Candidatus Latescibacteria bacterium]|nr:flagellar type III secretion system pore protein FliP [Candidatus Latescibacterota bacterium]